MARKIATNRTVERDELLDFIRSRHKGVLSTTRINGRPQMSLVTMGLDTAGRIAIATYPERVKTANARRNPSCSLLVMGDEFNNEWVQVDGTIQVLDLPRLWNHFATIFERSAANTLTGRNIAKR